MNPITPNNLSSPEVFVGLNNFTFVQIIQNRDGSQTRKFSTIRHVNDDGETIEPFTDECWFADDPVPFVLQELNRTVGKLDHVFSMHLLNFLTESEFDTVMHFHKVRLGGFARYQALKSNKKGIKS